MKYTPKSTPWSKDRTKLKMELMNFVLVLIMVGLSGGLMYLISTPDPTEFDWRAPAEYVDEVDLANADEYYNLYCDDDPPIRIGIDKTSFEFIDTLGEHTCFMTKFAWGVESSPSERLTFMVYPTNTDATLRWEPGEDVDMQSEITP